MARTNKAVKKSSRTKKKALLPKTKTKTNLGSSRLTKYLVSALVASGAGLGLGAASYFGYREHGKRTDLAKEKKLAEHLFLIDATGKRHNLLGDSVSGDL